MHRVTILDMSKVLSVVRGNPPVRARLYEG